MPEEWCDHTIGELQIRQKYHVNVLGIKHKGTLDLEITPQTKLAAEDTILVVGRHEDVHKYFQL